MLEDNTFRLSEVSSRDEIAALALGHKMQAYCRWIFGDDEEEKM